MSAKATNSADKSIAARYCALGCKPETRPWRGPASFGITRLSCGDWCANQQDDMRPLV